MKRFFAVILAAATAAGNPAAEAAELTVSPLSIQMTPGRTNAQVTLEAAPGEPVAVQARVFRWVQTNGKDDLVRTTDVIASPPAAKVAAGRGNTIRLLRVAKTPVQQEESYRVLIDQLPQARGAHGASLRMVMRYSIPIFVTPAGWSAPELNWDVRRDGPRLVVTATNTGNTRAKITGLSLVEQNGRGRLRREGLIGYVLAGSSRTWEFDAGNGAFAQGGSLAIEADTQSAGQQAAHVAIR